MGLDSVEILMEVEKTFNIRIPDQQAQKIITVEDFHKVVWQHIEGRHHSACQSQQFFYRVRRALVNDFHLSKENLRLDSPVADFFPSINRRQHYLEFAKTNNIELPQLVLTKTGSLFLQTIGTLTILGGFFLSLFLNKTAGLSGCFYLVPVGGVCITLLLSRLLEPLRTVIVPFTFRDFARDAYRLNFSALSKDGVDRRDMEQMITYIIAERAGLDIKEVTPEKKICDDLGID